MHILFKQSAAVLFAISTLTAQAYAENPAHYCQYYAKHAVHLGEIARSVSSCRHLVEADPQRWSLNYDQHFAYCMRIFGSGAGASEDATRTHEIKFCGGR